ncbi:aminoglycoside phosphotransferase family protein [Haloplasma contractile]|uniref:Phosphotransferase protein n=1 Tax=Haloplasma contractile SSD-17B TaxID=1033810 RepID=F7Q224_9MOLU|nr:aminoglycoside phosphotransferase family protein [Haloplasma contractile]ERJ12168.1 Putative phosphotransferase protein [Haloplasma contractile SSD-17B]
MIMDDKEILQLLRNDFGVSVCNLKRVKSGNIKTVFSFTYERKEYVIRFSKGNNEFETEQFLYKLTHKNDHMARLIKIGTYKNLYYSITERVKGCPLKELNLSKVKTIIPQLIESVTCIHQTDLTPSCGYGWIKDGNGCFSSFRELIETHFKQEQNGFWNDWYTLFEDSFLDYDSFMTLYKEMVRLSPYSDGQRFLTHGDFHFSNIFSDGKMITGIIDWGNVMYGDFILDIAMLHMLYPSLNFKEAFKNYYNTHQIKVENYDKRFICMSLFKGLDTLRFAAKTGDRPFYKSLLNYLQELIAQKKAEDSSYFSHSYKK